MLAPLLMLTGLVLAAGTSVPNRTIPPSVLAEVQLLENRFNQALAADCNDARCFSNGCTYVDHAVADRPRSGSLPGLNEEAGPGGAQAQEYLTRAQCSFSNEATLSAGDVQALVRRLQTKLSTGWTVVSVVSRPLEPLPAWLREPPAPEAGAAVEPEEEPEPVATEPEPWSSAVAGRELWHTLLPHFFWMIGVGLVTLAGMVAIWSWRRVGRASIEEQALLAQMAREDGGNAEPEAVVVSEQSDDADWVAEQEVAWTRRLAEVDAEHPDPELQNLVRELLRAGDLPLLAKAVLRFPERFPGAFPSGGDVAAAKLELADALKTVDPASLPSDRAFFEALNRQALAATLLSQGDAEVVRSLREDFGAAGLVGLMRRLPARPGALIMALAPATEQHEMVRLLSHEERLTLTTELLRSNRMDPRETTDLFGALRAERDGLPLPPPEPTAQVSDRGTPFDAVGALSVFLPTLQPHRRAALFEAVLQRTGGALPAWYRGILEADMLFELSAEARADLVLEVEAEALAAWLSLLDAPTRSRLLGEMPASLRMSVQAMSVFPSWARQLALAERGRRDLARGFQRQLARAGLSFEDVMLSAAPERA